MRRKLMAMALACAVFACGGKKETQSEAVSHGAKALTADELKAAFSGNTLSGTLDMGMMTVKFDSFHAADGSASGVARTSMGDDKDKGTWRIEADGKLCTKWGKWNDAQERCVVYFKQGNEYKSFNDEGNLLVKASIAAGNAKNL